MSVSCPVSVSASAAAEVAGEEVAALAAASDTTTAFELLSLAGTVELGELAAP